jgi:hypothetical protein
VRENHADAAAKRDQASLVERGDVLSFHDNASGAWRLEAIDRSQKARLAGAAPADDPEYRSALYGEIDVMQRANGPGGRSVDLPDAIEYDRRRSAGRGRRGRLLGFWSAKVANQAVRRQFGWADQGH